MCFWRSSCGQCDVGLSVHGCPNRRARTESYPRHVAPPRHRYPARFSVLPAGRAFFSKAHRFLLLDIFLLGTFGIVPAQLGLVFGVARTLASNASVLNLTVPILMAVSAVIFLGEQMTRMRWASFVVALVGVALVSANDLGQSQLFRGEYVVGNALVLVCCAGSAFYNSYSRRALALLSPAQVLVFSFLVADAELLLLSLLRERRLASTRTSGGGSLVESWVGRVLQPWSLDAALLCRHSEH